MSTPSSDTRPPRWVWIGGWGLHPEPFRSLAERLHPAANHCVLPPSSHALDDALRLEPDVLAGYSLGALLILSNEVPRTIPSILGIAPIFAFDAEAGQGGLTPKRSRLALTARFHKDPQAAIRLYLRLAGMADCCHDTLPYPEADLIWGLEALGSLQARADSLARAALVTGLMDPLTDAKVLRERCPALRTVPDCGHDYRQLLPLLLPPPHHARL